MEWTLRTIEECGNQGVLFLKEFDKIIVPFEKEVLNQQICSKETIKKVQQLLKNVVEKELPGIIDLNLGVEYRLSKLLSVFADFNNIGSVKYYEWNQYPAQRFNFMLGGTYVF